MARHIESKAGLKPYLKGLRNMVRTQLEKKASIWMNSSIENYHIEK